MLVFCRCGLSSLSNTHISLFSLLPCPAQSTGITGLAVHPNPRAHLVSVYKDTLKSLERLPSHSVYRQATEALTSQRLGVVESTEDISKIEATLGAGQIEEVIVQAEDEAKLVPEMEKWKA